MTDEARLAQLAALHRRVEAEIRQLETRTGGRVRTKAPPPRTHPTPPCKSCTGGRIRMTLEEVLAQMRAERYSPALNDERRSAAPPPPPPISEAEAAENARTLMRALGEDPYAADWDTRQEGD